MVSDAGTTDEWMVSVQLWINTEEQLNTSASCKMAHGNFPNWTVEHTMIGQCIKGMPVIGCQKQTNFYSTKYSKWVFYDDILNI